MIPTLPQVLFATRRPVALLSLGLLLLSAGRADSALPDPGPNPHAVAARGGQAERIALEDYDFLDFDRRRGKLRALANDLEEILDEVPEDFLALTLRARVRFAQCDYGEAVRDATEADALARGAADAGEAERALCTRNLARILIELGRAPEALEQLSRDAGVADADRGPRDAWLLARALLASGERTRAFELLRTGAEAMGTFRWPDLVAQARCQRRLGRVREASQSLVMADKLAREAGGAEPEVLVALGEVYFEAYGEVDDRLSRAHSPAELFREALRLDEENEGARLGLFELSRFNWRRNRVSPESLLQEIFEARPHSIRGLLARASAALDDGDLRRARADIGELTGIAPARRDVRTLGAVLAWIEHRREEARATLADLSAADPADGVPEREIGATLLELYRFAEAKPFLEASVERDPKDWDAWTLLGRAQANTGDEKAGLASLHRAEDMADGRRDARRDNLALVLERMDESMVLEEEQDLSFRWMPDAGPVLARYLVPFYRDAREELAARYGYTPDPVRIEVFRKWEDFSVRSTGFEGFPALGVCFGPVVTAVSPLSRLRGTFSWARTSFHEFTHVIHLGLSHNRCPRWITEGLATWEEGRRSRAWWRNLRREMLDARANDAIFPIRRLNGAFRGPRVIFAYYEGGLLCEMLIEGHGFAPMVRLLESFDGGADLDSAVAEVFGQTPEEIDAEFLTFVDKKLGGLLLEPRWSKEKTFQRRFRLSREVPEGEGERGRWQEEWCRVAWGSYWVQEMVDAGEALRIAGTAGELPPRGLFLRGELGAGRGDYGLAKKSLERGFQLGGEDFRARMIRAALAMKAHEADVAEQHLLAAEGDFPGYDDPRFCAELQLAGLYDEQGRGDEANEARLRWLAFNAGNFEVHFRVAGWLERNERGEEAAEVYREANEIDPFRRHLHLAWGRTLAGLGRQAEALREFEVGLLVPRELDGDLLRAAGGPVGQAHGSVVDTLVDKLGAALSEAQEAPETLDERFTREGALLEGWRALTLLELGRAEEARAAVARALAIDPEAEPALRAKERLP